MEKTKPDVSLFVLKALKDEGVRNVFFVPGFVIDPFLPNFSKAGVNAIVAAHEGGSAYMADGYGRASMNFGVCMGVGGPGVTNMVSAVSAAYGDHAPILVIAGKIPAGWEGRGTFQDSSSATGIDDVAIMRPMTGFAAVVPEVGLLDSFLKKAVRTMRGDSLPAFLSIPEDLHKSSYGASYSPQPRGPRRMLDAGALVEVPQLLDASRIVILAGNGCVHSEASKELQELAERYSIPVVTTMRAKGVMSEAGPMSFGVFGVGGSLQADKLVLGSKSPSIPKAEAVLALGATLNENNTHFRHERFSPEKILLRVDINPNSTGNAEYEEHFVTGDVKTFLEWATSNKDIHRMLTASMPARKKWIEAVRRTPYYDEEPARTKSGIPIHPAFVIAKLRDIAPRDSVLVVDSGAHTFFAGHHWTSYGPNEFLFSSTMGPMGYGIAMGIGAKIARPEKPCVCIVGDGSMLMHGMELHTAVRYSVPITIVVINNSALGNVYLRARDEGRDAAELAKIPTHDWAGFARSLGAEGIRVSKPSELQEAYESALKHTSRPNTPFLIDVLCDRECRAPNQFAT